MIWHLSEGRSLVASLMKAHVFCLQVKEPSLQFHQTKPDDSHVALWKSGEASWIMQESSQNVYRKVFYSTACNCSCWAILRLPVNVSGQSEKQARKSPFKIQWSTFRKLDVNVSNDSGGLLTWLKGWVSIE